MKLANRMSRLGMETAFEVLQRARALEAEGRDIIHLEIGEPDFDTPENIINAAKNSLDEGWTHYVPSPGIPELRDSIAKFISRTRAINVERENVCVLPGAKPVIYYLLHLLCEKGDEVIYPNPGFPIYESVVKFVGARPVPVKLREDMEFSFDMERFNDLCSDKTKLVILNSPCNPTGGVLSREDLEKVARLANKYDFAVLSDEIYDRMVWEGEFNSIASLPGMLERTVILNGFSKTYAMTGWRVGYGVMRKDWAALIAKMVTNNESCTCAFSQRACIEALDGDQSEVQAMMEKFRERRDLFIDGLNTIEGISCVKPKGAFYAFPNVKSAAKMNCMEVADYFLKEYGVACLCGSSFGKYGEGYIRFSYAQSRERLSEALERIGKAMDSLL